MGGVRRRKDGAGGEGSGRGEGDVRREGVCGERVLLSLRRKKDGAG